MARSGLAALLARVPNRAPYRKYLAASYAESTRMAYEADIRHFRRWGGRIPATPMQLAHYLAAFAGKLAFATLSRRVAAIHREHNARGLRSPARSELVRATLRGIARTYTRKQRQMRPLLREHLVRMVGHMRSATGARDRALLLVGFLGGFRRSELTALDARDVQLNGDDLAVTIRRSKTDQESIGRVVTIPGLRGKLCAVRALRSWLRVRPEGSEPLFCSFTQAGRPTGRRLSGLTVAHIVKRYVAAIRLDPSQFAGHSLRAGFVTSAARAGAATWQIRQQTGHKTDSVVAGYIRDTSTAGASVARLVGMSGTLLRGRGASYPGNGTTRSQGRRDRASPRRTA